ncbi:MAG: GDP-mannose 4,6-dehydratase [Candidatus Pacebacteria bacterium]|nr:GDP-mannose 4,6-dehydratase [Candidatus Paceibacterota bacterium]
MKSDNKKTYLVTGGTGFIGSHMCEKLLSLEHKVICLDNLSTGSLDNISHLKDNINFVFIRGDANNFKDIKQIFENNKLDGVFHYAAVVGVKRTIEDPLSVLRDIDGVKNILDLALQYGEPKVVFASSSEVYGEPVELPEKEDGILNCRMPYAVVKLLSEKFLETYYEKFGLKTCALRFFNVYGPRQESSDYGFVIGIFIKQVLRGQSPTIFGDGSQTRDFVFIDDNIEAGLRAMDSDLANGQAINVGRGNPITISDLANKVIEAAGQKGKIEPKLIENDKNYIKHRVPDISKMEGLLNFKPGTLLESGLEKTIAYYKKD